MTQASRRCTARKSNGEPCKRPAVKGALICTSHGGKAPQVLAKAKVRAELESWGLGDTTLDPGEVLLRLVSQAAVRAEVYATEVARMADEHGLHDALVGDQLVMEPQTGKLHKVAEYVRGLASLEAAERDRCARFAEKAIAAGLAERQVRLAERTGALIEQVLTAAFADLELTDEQRSAAPDAIRRALAVVA